MTQRTPITSAQRFHLAMIQDMCIDLSQQGVFEASCMYTGASQYVDVITRRAGQPVGNNEARLVSAVVGSPNFEKQLSEMSAHLTKLLDTPQEPAA